MLQESYVSGQTTDFTALLTKAKGSGAQAILLGSLYNEAALMAKQAKGLGLNLPFYGDTSQVTQAFIDLGGSAVEGWHAVGTFDTNGKDPRLQQFVKDYQAKYGKVPNAFAAQSYDAANILIEAIAKSGNSRDKIQAYVTGVKDFPGVTGGLTFKQGDVEKQLVRFTVQNGKFVSQA